MSAMRDRYLNTLGVSGESASATSKREKALKRAYQMRNFEIEHYWKRAGYFWAFQAAIFAGLGFIWKEAESQSPTPWGPIPLMLAGLGVLTALANALAARGSKFWQKNWENHIYMLEDEFEGRLHKTVWVSKASFSVSRVNEGLSWFFVVFWIMVLLYVACKYVGSPPLSISAGWQWTVIIVLTAAAGFVLLCCAKSRFRGTRPEEDGSHGQRFSIGYCWGKPFIPFIRRYAPDEPTAESKAQNSQCRDRFEFVRCSAKVVPVSDHARMWGKRTCCDQRS